MKLPYRFASGLPALGTILLILAVLSLPKTMYLGWAAIAIILLDTCGIPWFVVMMLYSWLSKKKPN
jgi:hypothetical protein